MFCLNQVLSDEDSLQRVIWSDADITYLIDIENESAWPIKFESKRLEEMLMFLELVKVDDPYAKSNLKSIKSNSTTWIKRERAWKLIEKYIENPGIFIPNERGVIVREIMKNHMVTRQTVYRYLRRYWQRGMCKNSLIPDYNKSGNWGVKLHPKGKKLGRPRTLLKGIGCNVNEEIRNIFRKVIDERLLKEKHTTITDAHIISLNIIRSVLPNLNEDDLPTLDQFKYFYRKEYTNTKIIESQVSTIEFAKDYRPLSSTSTTEAIGPGFRCQIDATIADIYLISDHDRSRIVGRPVIYMVPDVYSRLILGMYVGFEGPSWTSGMMAVANVAENKVEYCKRYGIDINEKDWPVEGLPNIILADKGEFLGTKVETFTEAFGVRIENATARRGDAKGIVERNFGTIQCTFKPYAPGIVEPYKSKKRGGKDYRKDAALTLHEFTQIIIKCVLYHNNFHTMSTYDRDAGIPESIPNVPVKIWNWGISNLTGKLRNADLNLVKVNLMPHAMATISENGICLFGCYFTSSKAIELGWFHRKISNRPAKISVAYDMRSADKIYIRPSDDLSEYWTCELSDRSRRFRGMTFWDVLKIRRDEKKSNNDSKLDSLLEKGILIADIEEIISKAIANKPNHEVISSNLKNGEIHKNKKLEKNKEREATAFRLGVQSSDSKDNVVPIKEKNSFKYPDLNSLLFEEDDD